MAENTPPESGGSAPQDAAPSGFKVELDIDDAPFLDEPEEEAPEEKPEEAPEAAPPVPVADDAPKAAGLKALLADKKKLALVGGGVLVLLIGILAGTMLFSGGEKEEETPAPPPQPEEQLQSQPEPKKDDPPPPPPDPIYTFEAEPFFVELRGSEGEIRFLHCRFSLPTKNYTLYTELIAKNIAVRDAVHYYLSNKPLTFLENPDAGYALKKDLLSVVNENMTSGSFEELLFDDYFVTGGR